MSSSGSASKNISAAAAAKVTKTATPIKKMTATKQKVKCTVLKFVNKCKSLKYHIKKLAMVKGAKKAKASQGSKGKKGQAGHRSLGKFLRARIMRDLAKPAGSDSEKPPKAEVAASPCLTVSFPSQHRDNLRRMRTLVCLSTYKPAAVVKAKNPRVRDLIVQKECNRGSLQMVTHALAWKPRARDWVVFLNVCWGTLVHTPVFGPQPLAQHTHIQRLVLLAKCTELVAPPVALLALTLTLTVNSTFSVCKQEAVPESPLSSDTDLPKQWADTESPGDFSQKLTAARSGVSVLQPDGTEPSSSGDEDFDLSDESKNRSAKCKERRTNQFEIKKASEKADPGKKRMRGKRGGRHKKKALTDI